MSESHSSSLNLLRPVTALRDEFISFCSEFPQASSIPGIGCLNPADFEASVRLDCLHAQGQQLPEGWVPSKTFWLVEDQHTIIGTINLRSRLTPALMAGSGHIGFSVRPRFRGQGYAGVMLGKCLKVARDDGLARVLVTCDRTNIASAKVIERCGGRLESEVAAQGSSPTWIYRYWIELEGRAEHTGPVSCCEKAPRVQSERPAAAAGNPRSCEPHQS
jgi:predicted acetyltransferase